MNQTTRKSYPTDLTDEQWEILDFVIPAAKHATAHLTAGRPSPFGRHAGGDQCLALSSPHGMPMEHAPQ